MFIAATYAFYKLIKRFPGTLIVFLLFQNFSAYAIEREVQSTEEVEVCAEVLLVESVAEKIEPKRLKGDKVNYQVSRYKDTFSSQEGISRTEKHKLHLLYGVIQVDRESNQYQSQG